MKEGAISNKMEVRSYPCRYLGGGLWGQEEQLLLVQNEQRRQRGEGTREGEQILAFMLSKKGRHLCL